MRLDQVEHKKIMLNILADISAHPGLALALGFKGGTCCYFLHGLDRFSVDLDFDLLKPDKQTETLAELDKILAKYGTTSREGRVFSRKLKYQPDSSAIKIDVSDRFDINRLNTYQVEDIVSGLPLNVLSKEDMFSHKLAALTERYYEKTIRQLIANRDLYDIYWFFAQNWDFNPDIIKLRTGQTAAEYLQTLKKFIEKKVDQTKILEGLGALVDDKKRQWVKDNLKPAVIKQLAIQIEAMRK